MVRGPGIPAGLTTLAIARTALELADEQGIAALTVRGVARRLGVEPMSIYHYFAGKEALLDAVWDEVLAEGMLPAQHPADSWQEFLRATAHRYRDALRAHPNLLSLMLGRGARTARSLDLVQAAIVGLTTRGVPLMLALDIINVLSLFSLAHTMSEHRSDADEAPAAIDPVRHALLVDAVGRRMTVDPAADDDRRFAETVEALITGYAPRIAEDGDRSSDRTHG